MGLVLFGAEQGLQGKTYCNFFGLASAGGLNVYCSTACLPCLGYMAVTEDRKVTPLFLAGKHNEAEEASKRAEQIAFLAIVFGAAGNEGWRQGSRLSSQGEQGLCSSRGHVHDCM